MVTNQRENGEKSEREWKQIRERMGKNQRENGNK